ncbi:MAG: hypothetical protein ACXVBE_06975, partial [Bdellovibrionota bacterium]
YPNDKRPPITIDGTTAQRLLNGQLTAEGVYYDRTVGAAAAAAKKSEESSSGNGVGWQVAESTYVPLSADGDAKNPNATNSSSLMKAMPAAGVTASSFAGGSNGSSGAGAGATMPAVAGQITVNNASGGGSGGGGGGAVARAPAAAASYTGDAGTAATGNLTYSQQIDAAMKQATTSACGRMGSYAQGGYCSK